MWLCNIKQTHSISNHDNKHKLPLFCRVSLIVSTRPQFSRATPTSRTLNKTKQKTQKPNQIFLWLDFPISWQRVCSNYLLQFLRSDRLFFANCVAAECRLHNFPHQLAINWVTAILFLLASIDLLK